VIAFAVEQERRAYEFYAQLAKTVTNPWTRKALEEFAEREREHETKLRQIESQGHFRFVPKYVQNLKLADYLTAIVFPHEGMDTREAYALAIKAEASTYRLYLDLAHKVEEAEIRNLFLALAQEEAEHKLKLETEYDEHVFAQN